MGDVVDMCPENLTGADFYALCSNALMNAIRRQVLDQDSGIHTYIDACIVSTMRRKKYKDILPLLPSFVVILTWMTHDVKDP